MLELYLYLILTATVMAFVFGLDDTGKPVTIRGFVSLALFWWFYVILAVGIIQRYGPVNAMREGYIEEFLDDTCGKGFFRKAINLLVRGK